MIFGFNSEVKYEGTSYHVQSEVRAGGRLLDTQVFVGGRCVGKRSTALPAGEALSDESIREQLKEQHRRVLEAVREGELPKRLAEPNPGLQWLSVRARLDEKRMVLRFHIDLVPARVHARLEADGTPTTSAEADAAPDGTVELELPFDSPAATATLFLQTQAADRTITQKFRLHRN